MDRNIGQALDGESLSVPSFNSAQAQLQKIWRTAKNLYNTGAGKNLPLSRVGRSNKTLFHGSSPMSKHSLQQEFSQLYDTYADSLFRHIYLRINDRERAKDLVQETFMRSWRYVAGGEVLEQPRAFLYRVANNLVINEYERRKPTVSADQMLNDGTLQLATDEHDSTQDRLDAELVIKILGELNNSYRQVVIMRFVDGLPIREIAEILNESENNISVRLHRALKLLQKHLRGKYQQYYEN